jgi:hypothetical protein
MAQWTTGLKGDQSSERTVVLRKEYDQLVVEVLISSELRIGKLRTILIITRKLIDMTDS